jgi:hypothetical protein
VRASVCFSLLNYDYKLVLGFYILSALLLNQKDKTFSVILFYFARLHGSDSLYLCRTLTWIFQFVCSSSESLKEYSFNEFYMCGKAHQIPLIELTMSCLLANTKMILLSINGSLTMV